jgi:hypothetical protein
MLTPEEKKDFATKLNKIRDDAAKMLSILEKEEWERLVDAGYEMDSEMDFLYDHLTKVMIEIGYNS